jgi:hypothetical protein
MCKKMGPKGCARQPFGPVPRWAWLSRRLDGVDWMVAASGQPSAACRSPPTKLVQSCRLGFLFTKRFIVNSPTIDTVRLASRVVHRPGELPGPSRYHAWLFRNWRAGYDLEAIGRIGDFVTVMTYSQHTRRTPPGPNASVVWDRDVIEYFLRFIPAEKLSLGIPTLSQHWYTSQEDQIIPEMARSYSRTVTWERAMGLIERNDAELHWDDRHQVPFAYFDPGGTFEWVFMENARSFRAKLGLVEEFGLRGFSVWVLGFEDPGVWPLLVPRR